MVLLRGCVLLFREIGGRVYHLKRETTVASLRERSVVRKVQIHGRSSVLAFVEGIQDLWP